MNKKYEMVKRWYDCGVFSQEQAEKMVRDAVGKGWITAEEYEKITGIAYDNV